MSSPHPIPSQFSLSKIEDRKSADDAYQKKREEIIKEILRWGGIYWISKNEFPDVLVDLITENYSGLKKLCFNDEVSVEQALRIRTALKSNTHIKSITKTKCNFEDPIGNALHLLTQIECQFEDLKFCINSNASVDKEAGERKYSVEKLHCEEKSINESATISQNAFQFQKKLLRFSVEDYAYPKTSLNIPLPAWFQKLIESMEENSCSISTLNFDGCSNLGMQGLRSLINVMTQARSLTSLMMQSPVLVL